ncbi:MAG: hypothetical protein Q8O76_01160, partial [Chloroflexota bacterium]|nr:hypothetical protein [Chloroflexota bacterium]
MSDFSVAALPQTEWSWLRALSFCLTGLGAGLFLVSLWLDLPWGALAGWLLVLGGNATLLATLGRVERLWLTVLNFRLSWTSRGVVGSGVFTVLGLLYWALLLSQGIGFPGYWVIRGLAGLAALFLIILDG